jgi:SAM-dependent methyltransferase
MDFPREKKDLPIWKLSYKFYALINKILGRQKGLKTYLLLHRILNRFAHELSGDIFGSEYHNSAFALSEMKLLDSIPSNSRVLDVGCGSGRFTHIASTKAREVISIDHNSKHFSNVNFSALNVKAIEYDINDDFLVLGKFDLVLLIHILEHIDDPKSLLVKLSRVTENLIIEVPDRESDPLNWVRIKLEMDYSSDHDHVREYSLALLERELRETGWQIHSKEKKGASILVFAGRII